MTIRESYGRCPIRPLPFAAHPCLGEHNAYVYGELLGYSPEEVEQLKAAGHIGDTYVEALLTPTPSETPR